jgi:hypothetical protein
MVVVFVGWSTALFKRQYILSLRQQCHVLSSVAPINSRPPQPSSPHCHQMLPLSLPILDPSTLFARFPLPSSHPLVTNRLACSSLPPHFVCTGWLFFPLLSCRLRLHSSCPHLSTQRCLLTHLCLKPHRRLHSCS